MNPGCWICVHYSQKSHLETRGIRNVSGELAKYRVWDKHRCKLKQEDRYPHHCDFEENKALRAELDKRYPDLAAARKKLKDSEKRVKVIFKEADALISSIEGKQNARTKN